MWRLAVAAVVALAGCGRSDDCQKMFDKLDALRGSAGGSSAMSAEDRMKALSQCRDGLAQHKGESLVTCVLAARDDGATRACLEAVNQK